MSAVIIDTNVPLVANGMAAQAGIRCTTACIDRLLAVRDGEIVLIDDSGLVFDEYQRYLAHSGQPGVGDAFFKYLWDNQANDARCRRVPITPADAKWPTFAEFPQDPDLQTFDVSDRKFVAIAVAAGSSPPIVNASDTDWWRAREVLARHGVSVEFLCPELMK